MQFQFITRLRQIWSIQLFLQVEHTSF
jgi:hypothetical protein